MANNVANIVSESQIQELAAKVITTDVMKKLAEGPMGLGHTIVKNCELENAGNSQGFGSDLLRKWKNKNSGGNQVQASYESRRNYSH